MHKTKHESSDNIGTLSLSIVLLCYNEEASIEDTVSRCIDALRLLVDEYEIIIVDDGSTDESLTIAHRIQRDCDPVRVIHNPINLGAGISIRIGWEAARYDLVLHNGMDYPFDLNDLEKILLLFPESDAVAMVRTDRSAHSPYRKLTSLVNYWLIRFLFNIKLHDMNFVQIYKKKVLDTISVVAKSPAFVTPETLIRAQDTGFKISEVRVPFHPRKKGEATHGRPTDIFWTLADMFSFWLERIGHRKR